jgi:hypothetical protein
LAANLDLGTLFPGDTGTGTLTVSNPDPGDGSAAPVDVSIGGGFVFDDNGTDATTVSVPVGGGTVTVKVVVLAGAAAGPLTGTVTGGAAPLTVAATVEHKLEVTPSLSFGGVVVGSNKTANLFVTNLTSDDATVAVTGAGYTAASTTVPPGITAATVVITFAPTAEGGFPATLTVTAGSRSGTCAVNGAGIVAGATTTATDSNEDGAVDGSEVKTTYKVHVPSDSTKLHLGAAVTPFDNLDGFGLRTSAKGLLHADGSIGINSSTGSLLLQAQADDGAVISVSGGNSVFAAKGSAYLLGDSGVLVTTAIDVATSVGTDGIPDTGEMSSGSTAAAAVFTALDAVIAGASAVRAIKTTPWTKWSSKQGQRTQRRSIAAGVVSTGAALAATGLGIASVASAHDDVNPSIPGVTVYGHAGVLMGTPGYGGFYAAAGLVLSSIFPVLMGVDSEILGVRSAAVTGNDVSLEAWNDIEAEAGNDATLKAANKVTVAVDPNAKTATSLTIEDESLTILVGSYAVTVTAANGILVGSNTAAGGAVDTAKPYVEITDGVAALRGAGAPNQRPTVWVTDKKAVVTGGTNLADAGQLSLEDNKSTLWAKQSKLTLDGAADSIELKAATLQANGTEVTIKGKKISIG